MINHIKQQAIALTLLGGQGAPNGRTSQAVDCREIFAGLLEGNNRNHASIRMRCSKI